MIRASAIALCMVLSTPVWGQARDWAFVQSVGGLSIGEPFHKDGSWHLPVRCDVSGLRTITTKPTSLNSALTCSTVARVEKDAIYIAVITRLPGSQNSAACPPARLGSIANGRYKVFYSTSSSERISVGDINIAL